MSAKLKKFSARLIARAQDTGSITLKLSDLHVLDKLIHESAEEHQKAVFDSLLSAGAGRTYSTPQASTSSPQVSAVELDRFEGDGGAWSSSPEK